MQSFAQMWSAALGYPSKYKIFDMFNIYFVIVPLNKSYIKKIFQ